jgi:ribosomal protein S24E
MKILEDKNNELLKRREIKLVVDAAKNPSIQEAAKIIADQFKVAAEENIKVNVVKGKFGRKTFLISASIYESKDDKEKTEVITRKQRAAKQAGKGEKKEENKEEKKEEKGAGN